MPQQLQINISIKIYVQLTRYFCDSMYSQYCFLSHIHYNLSISIIFEPNLAYFLSKLLQFVYVRLRMCFCEAKQPIDSMSWTAWRIHHFCIPKLKVPPPFYLVSVGSRFAAEKQLGYGGKYIYLHCSIDISHDIYLGTVWILDSMLKINAIIGISHQILFYTFT